MLQTEVGQGCQARREIELVDLCLVCATCSEGRDFSVGFKKAWELLSQNSSLLA